MDWRIWLASHWHEADLISNSFFTYLCKDSPHCSKGQTYLTKQPIPLKKNTKTRLHPSPKISVSKLSFCIPPAHLYRQIKFNACFPILFFGLTKKTTVSKTTWLRNAKRTTCFWSVDKKRNALFHWGGKPEVFHSLLGRSQSQALRERAPPALKARSYAC